MPDLNNLKIITSDDGLGEPIQLRRVGLFENLKSKFGADGELNSGSHGEYRQLVGDFTADAGILDATRFYLDLTIKVKSFFDAGLLMQPLAISWH